MADNLQAFQAFLYANIPLVRSMDLKLDSLSSDKLTASAPLAPNINDKKTVFGGSSAALMTICGWSLIKYHLEQCHVLNDVVIHQAKTQWLKAQTNDLIITAYCSTTQNWQQLSQIITKTNRSQKLNIECQVLDNDGIVYSQMSGDFVILKSKS